MEPQSAVVDFSNRAEKVGFLARLGVLSGRWKIDLKPYRARRSVKQNAKYWVSIIPAFREYMRQHGQYFNADEVHEFLLQTLASRMVIDPETGEAIATIGSRSSKMDVGEFSDYMNKCTEYLWDRFGIVIQEPEYLEKKSENG